MRFSSTRKTKAVTLLQFLQGLREELHVTLEEGTWAAWLYDVLKRHVYEVVVCNPRRNALLKEGSKSGKVDAPKWVALPTSSHEAREAAAAFHAHVHLVP
jgi:hypothetical protein